MAPSEARAVLQRHARAIRLHLILEGGARASERAPLEKLLKAWERDLKNRKGPPTRLSLPELAGIRTDGGISEVKRTALGNVRAYVSRVRKTVSRTPLLMDGYRFDFDITHDQYGLEVKCEVQKNRNLLRFWEPYLKSEKEAVIALVERLFFQLAPDVYIRNARVNNVEDYGKCKVLTRLVKRPPHPTSLYVSTGEAAAAFTMLNAFTNKLEIAAEGFLFSPGIRYPNNLVVMGSGTEEPRFDPPEQFRHRIATTGVANRRGRVMFPDKWGEERLLIHVLVSRWKNEDGYIVTTVHASHGRAIEGVCKHLSDDSLVEALFEKPFSPTALQLVFKTMLQREGTADRPLSIRCVRQQAY